MAAGCGASGPIDPGGRTRGTPTRLTPSAIGSPLGGAQPAVIGPAGGSVASLDGRLTAAVPAGAVPEPVAFTVQEITNTAPGAVGSAYRLGPGGATFAQPVTLTFTPGGSAALPELTVATQDGQDFWLRYRDVARDLAAGTLALTTTHLSDWAVVTANTSSDLRGPFTLHSTLDVPFDATGEATLNYGGDDAAGAHFLQWGTITVQSPVVIGAATCTPTAATWSLLVNVADLTTSPGKFDWGVSAIWPLDCRDANGTPSPASIVTAFDTFGIDHLGCARGYLGTPTLSPTQVSGSYVIDCGARGQITAQFQFRN